MYTLNWHSKYYFTFSKRKKDQLIFGQNLVIPATVALKSQKALGSLTLLLPRHKIRTAQ